MKLPKECEVTYTKDLIVVGREACEKLWVPTSRDLVENVLSWNCRKRDKGKDKRKETKEELRRKKQTADGNLQAPSAKQRNR